MSEHVSLLIKCFKHPCSAHLLQCKWNSHLFACKNSLHTTHFCLFIFLNYSHPFYSACTCFYYNPWWYCSYFNKYCIHVLLFQILYPDASMEGHSCHLFGLSMRYWLCLYLPGPLPDHWSMILFTYKLEPQTLYLSPSVFLNIYYTLEQPGQNVYMKLWNLFLHKSLGNHLWILTTILRTLLSLYSSTSSRL